MKVDPKDLKNGSSDDDGVESIEGRREKKGGAQSVHPNEHFENEGTKEHELHVD